MKNLIFVLLFSSVLFVSCKTNDPALEYKYTTNPTYSWGYAEFYGPYYSEYMNDNNVISLSLFSDSLFVDSTGSLDGIGQYLFLEDIFISPTDTILPDGVYEISKSEAPFTVAPGEKFKADNNEYVIGASIYFIEKKSNFSVQKLISRGSFTVESMNNTKYIDFNFVLTDSTKLKGKFSTELPHFDQSIATPPSSVRKKLKLKSGPVIF